MNDFKVKDSVEIISENYTEFSKYVIATRAYPNIIDGCKMVHKRCIHCCYEYLPRHLIKSAEASGKITVLHPHPQSIYGVLVSLASKYDCKFPLYDTKGNFGGFGFPAAAERYTELMLSDLAIKIFEPFANYVDMVPGEMNTEEPYALASLLPLCFLHGTYGISSGMSNVKIPALNPVDLIKYYIKVLESKDINSIPDVLIRPNMGNVGINTDQKEWKEILRTGKGQAKYVPTMEMKGKTITITGVPEGRSIDNLFKALSSDINLEKIDVRDESTYSVKYVIEAVPRKWVDMNEIYKKAKKALTVSETYNFIFADEGIAVFCGLYEVVRRNLEYTMKCCKRKLATEIDELKYKLRVLEIIQELKSNNKKLHDFIEMDQKSAIKFLISEYKADEEQAKSVLNKPISYLTREHDSEIEDLKKSIAKMESDNQDIYSYLVEIYKSLLKEVKSFTKDNDVTNFVKEK